MTFTPEALVVMDNIATLLYESRHWAELGQWMDGFPDIEKGTDQAAMEYHKMKGYVDQMELSWSRSITGLIQLAAGLGGLRIMRDGEHSLYFHAPETGLCGAVILHWKYRDGQRLNVGFFSINT